MFSAASSLTHVCTSIVLQLSVVSMWLQALFSLHTLFHSVFHVISFRTIKEIEETFVATIFFSNFVSILWDLSQWYGRNYNTIKPLSHKILSTVLYSLTVCKSSFAHVRACMRENSRSTAVSRLWRDIIMSAIWDEGLGGLLSCTMWCSALKLYHQVI
jgi:hypothetical protein